ncbi:MAG: GIY-YIG nuclease family protein [Candidatus Thioglobus sp.]|jgi:putative endonuclease|uniref:GIY-YIG nuclease family protein n=1 Tax=Candidatus Thioglobus sp. TaxID=2026721 RepID=UPI0001BD3939|nr:GIY-YIG nuclease family protein [Candidatus Thioglobus sp.]EEZ79597.1 MAG: endonuclease [uncultured Candidatus Thioglobus sp.]MBT3186398.1 GIY-YIG nuclease family protein [Candidatus Thioglobus sp.]MBT4316297.1 GIY-YIG nuclease family protein [Candidatus Thioglobus sp.]MBT4553467.1 GIY-YIG nuclease family protein [Candidatus Thioglobus sp.]MBT4923181.1 GIY-YIG nuclease family protein [Candidatus Thioglobus sp.]
MTEVKYWTVYLLRCRDNNLYCGITNHLDRRIRQHNGELKGGAKYTRANGPCELVYQEKSKDRSSASKREHEIKTMSRDDKLLLIKSQ